MMCFPFVRRIFFFAIFNHFVYELCASVDHGVNYGSTKTLCVLTFKHTFLGSYIKVCVIQSFILTLPDGQMVVMSLLVCLQSVLVDLSGRFHSHSHHNNG